MAIRFPTPRTNSLCGGSGAWAQIQGNPALSPEEKRALSSTRGQLNPDWVEWLMCWPVGWTDPETPVSRLLWLDPSLDPASPDGQAALGLSIPRATARRAHRAARIRAIGNGQFPPTAHVMLAWGLALLQPISGGCRETPQGGQVGLGCSASPAPAAATNRQKGSRKGGAE